MATRPTWNTKVLDSINRMMIRFSRMAVSWMLREGSECVRMGGGFSVLFQALAYMKSTS